MINFNTFYNDLSTLTTLSVSFLSKLDKNKEALMCSYIDEAVKNGEEEIRVDIGIGSLFFTINGDEMTYKFVPSSEFEKMIVNTVVEGRNPLEKMLEERVSEQMLKIYKELL